MPKETFSALQRFLFVGTLLGVSALTLWVLWPFVMSIFWAVVLAIMLRPVFLWFLERVRRPALASLLTMLATLLVAGVPLYQVGMQAATEALDLYQRIGSDGISLSTVTEGSYAASLLESFGISGAEAEQRLTELAKNTISVVAEGAFSIGRATAGFLLKFGVMLYLLFFFLKDGARLGQYLERIIPLGDERERLLFARFASTTRAVVKGTLIVALVQGAVGALLFFVAGVGSPVLWGAIMAFCALIPAVGPFIVWLPAGIALLLMGSMWQGLVILLGGAFVIGSIDNILRPVLVGRDSEMPDALVLLAILGGIATFGIAGVIIGPVIAALFLSLWDSFGKEFSEEIALRG